jgi:hypothetical protein
MDKFRELSGGNNKTISAPQVLEELKPTNSEIIREKNIIFAQEN